MPTRPADSVDSALSQEGEGIADSKKSLLRPNGSERRNSGIDFLFLTVLLCAVAFEPVRNLSAGSDADLWLNLRTGDWIMQHGAVPSHDLFSAPMMGKDWVVYHWLFAVLSAKLFGFWGLRGVTALTALLTMASTAALTAILCRYTNSVRSMALAATAHIAMLPLGTPRSWLFTILFFTLELWFLLEACQKGRRGWLLPIIPLMGLWANIHIQFVYGLGLIGLFALQQSLPFHSEWRLAGTDSGRFLPARWLWFTLLASFIATLANPYGWRLYTVVTEYATERAPLRFVTEMQPLQFRDLSSWTTLLLVCLGWFALGRASKRNALLLILMAVSCGFGFRASRDLWFPVIVSSLAVAYSMGSSGAEIRQIKQAHWALALWLSSLFAVIIPFGTSTEAALQKFVAEHFPVAATAWIQSHALPTPLYNSYGWGGYLIWRLPGMPVSIDGRANLYGDDRLMRAAQSIEGDRNWVKDPELAKAKTILLERGSALASILRSNPRFRLVYEDDVASIFQPASPVP